MLDFLLTYRQAKKHKAVLLWSPIFEHYVWWSFHRPDLELIIDFRDHTLQQ